MPNRQTVPKIVTVGLRKSIFYLIVLGVIFYSPALDLILKESKTAYTKFSEARKEAKIEKLLDSNKWPLERNIKFANGAVNLNIKLKPLDGKTLGYILNIDPAYPTSPTINGLWFNFSLRDKDGFLLKDFQVKEHQMVSIVNENKIRIGATIEDKVLLEIESAARIVSIDYSYGGDPLRLKAFEQLADASPMQISISLENEKREKERLAEERRLAEIEKQKEEERRRLREAEEFQKQMEERKKRELADKIRIAEEEKAKELAIKQQKAIKAEQKRKAIEKLKNRWEQIHTSMNGYSVESLLGKPNSITTIGEMSLWSYPGNGQVTINRNKVYSFHTPSWRWFELSDDWFE